MVISWYLKGEWRASHGGIPTTAHDVYTHIHYKIIHQHLNITQLIALIFGSICYPISQDRSLSRLQNYKSNAAAYIVITVGPVGYLVNKPLLCDLYTPHVQILLLSFRKKNSVVYTEMCGTSRIQILSALVE
jgi:hypothetical protein